MFRTDTVPTRDSVTLSISLPPCLRLLVVCEVALALYFRGSHGGSAAYFGLGRVWLLAASVALGTENALTVVHHSVGRFLALRNIHHGV